MTVQLGIYQPVPAYNCIINYEYYTVDRVDKINMDFYYLFI
jgi:hypothetical protein